MAYIKFLEAGQNISCRTPVTSFAIDEGEAETLMAEVRRFVVSNRWVFVKDRPFSIKVNCYGEVVVKARVFRDADGVFFDFSRRSGDVVAFMQIWNEMQRCLCLRGRL